MLEYAKLIHEAIGIQSPKVFVALFALLGALVFGSIGWLIVKSSRQPAALPQNAPVEQREPAPNAGSLTTGPATANGDNSVANTGQIGSVSIGSSDENRRESK